MRYRIAVLASTVALLGGAGAAGGSYAAITHVTEPNVNGVVTSCYKTADGAVRLVNFSSACAAGETKLSWASNVKPKVHLIGAAGEAAYESDWKAYGGPPFGNGSFYKDSSGVVHLTGLACHRNGDNPSICDVQTLASGAVPIFTLPPGFRPGSQLLFTVPSVGSGVSLSSRIDNHHCRGGRARRTWGPGLGVLRRDVVPGQVTPVTYQSSTAG